MCDRCAPPVLPATRRPWRLLWGVLCCLMVLRPAMADPPLWSDRNPQIPPLPALQQLNESLRTLTRQLLPAVISLQVRTDKTSEVVLPKNHPPPQEEGAPTVTGSGFIIRADGLALTNAHVVEQSTSIDVHLYGGEMTTATVLGRDPVGDIALLRIAADRPLPVASLGNSTALEVGEFVMAIGSPFGFEHTVTFGLVSAKKRQFLRSGVFGGYIQTDAPITIGNSGGPLVNMRGEVVGINTVTVGRGELGFAIPIDAVKATLLQLHESGRVTRAWLGVQIRSLDRARAQTLGLTSLRGVYIHEVMQAQPAHQAGVLAGDVIVGFDGQTITTIADLQGLVATTPIGKKVKIELLRQRALQTVELVLGMMPEKK